MVSLGEADGNLVGQLQVLTEDDASAAQLGVRLLKAPYIVTLPAVNRDGNLGKLIQYFISIHAILGVYGFGYFIL